MGNNNIEERKTGNYKRRIVVVVLSMLLCMLLIGISVYAATSQTSTVDNTITISSSKQVRVGITVSFSNGVANDDRTLFENNETAVAAAKALSFTEIGTKSSSEDEKNLTGDTAIEFSYDNKYTYRVYKIEFNNTASSDITYAIEFQNESGAAYTFDSQVSVFTGKSADTTLTAGQTVSGNLDAEGNETIYIVVAMNTALIDATPVAQSAFKMVITANQKSGS